MPTIALIQADITTNVNRFPLERACHIALREVRGFFATHSLPERVVFCCFSAADLASYQRCCAEGPEPPAVSS